jgi:14-3-3 protein epsilon
MSNSQDFFEKNLYLAKVTEQSERYEETIKYMEEIVKNKKDDLTLEERNLLSAAYKNCVSSRRSAWRSIYGIEVKEKTNNSKHLPLVTDLKALLEKELNDLCDRMLKLIDNHLLKKATQTESRVFYLKMKGDYYRYLAEFTSGDKHAEIANLSADAYAAASVLANELSFTNPIKLGLALNYSVFYYEVLNDPNTACKIANEAFQAGIQHIEAIEDDQYKDSTTILQLLKENIDMWSVDVQEGNDDQMDEA